MSRTVIYEDSFIQALAAIEPNSKRADEFMVGVEWILARHPEEGIQPYANSRVWLLFTPDLINMPALTIYYSFDDQYVYLLLVEIGSYGEG